MAEFVEKTLFERALLASRLVDAAELVEVAQRRPGDPPGYNDDSDQRLAKRLVERGLLNAWQVEQLRAGRTKFTLGPYLIVDAIGKGGMGHLFKGRHELLGRIEAIKVLPKSRSTPQSIASFQHEIRAQAQLDHPNLVSVYFAGRDGDTHFLVTEFVPGVDLRRLVRRSGALRPDQAAAIIAQTADALEYAHRRGLVHRDVKPGNLLVCPDGYVKVTDLGLAWYLEDSFGAAPTGSGKIVGTCDYIPPESIQSPDLIMPVSDIYSLGCTLYYAVTGKVPFPGGNTTDKMRRHLADVPLDPRTFNNSLPKDMTALIQEMMQKDHHKRTPSAAVVAERLRPFVLEETARSLEALVTHSAPSPGARGVAGRPVTDLGETLVSLSDDALGSGDEHRLEAPSQASQGTDPVSGSAQDTAEFINKTSDWQASASSPKGPATEGRRSVHVNETHDLAVRWIVASAIGATLAIIIAAALRFS